MFYLERSVLLFLSHQSILTTFAEAIAKKILMRLKWTQKLISNMFAMRNKKNKKIISKSC